MGRIGRISDALSMVDTWAPCHTVWIWLLTEAVSASVVIDYASFSTGMGC